MPQDALSAVNIILSQSRLLNLNYTNIGKSFFRNDGHVIDLGFGKEVWSGIFSSVRPNSWTDRGTKLLATLNANIVHKVWKVWDYECLTLSSYQAATRQLYLVDKNEDYCYTDMVLDRMKINRDSKKSWKYGMNSQQINILRNDLKGLKVRYVLPNGQKREYRVNDILAPPNKLDIPDLQKTVSDYFFETYQEKLQYPHLPCLWLGSRNKTIYIPMEYCEVSSQALPRSKALPERAQADMIRRTARTPGEREKMIMQELQKNNAIYKNDPYAKAFNLSIADNLVELTGRILPPPSIEYQNQAIVKIRENDPGKWQQRGVKYVTGGELKNWAVLDLAKLTREEMTNVIQEFGKVGSSVGLKIQCQEKSVITYGCGEDYAGRKFDEIVRDFKKHNTKLDLVLVILPFKGGKVYNEIKNLGDLTHKIPTQCCVKKVLFKDGGPNGQVLKNAQKISSFLKIFDRLFQTCA